MTDRGPTQNAGRYNIGSSPILLQSLHRRSLEVACQSRERNLYGCGGTADTLISADDIYRAATYRLQERLRALSDDPLLPRPFLAPSSSPLCQAAEIIEEAMERSRQCDIQSKRRAEDALADKAIMLAGLTFCSGDESSNPVALPRDYLPTPHQIEDSARLREKLQSDVQMDSGRALFHARVGAIHRGEARTGGK